MCTVVDHELDDPKFRAKGTDFKKLNIFLLYIRVYFLFYSRTKSLKFESHSKQIFFEKKVLRSHYLSLGLS